MASVIDVLVPDGVEGATVIEIMLEAGAEVEAEESLLAIETDKATAEVPAPAAGKLLEIIAKVGDSVSSGSVIGKLQVAETAESSAPAAIEANSQQKTGAKNRQEDEADVPAPTDTAKTAKTEPASGGANIQDILVPDGVEGATVIEIMREAGAEIEAEESLLAIETDKATAEVPAPTAGTLLEITAKIGESVSSGSVIGKLQVAGRADHAAPAEKPAEAHTKDAKETQTKNESENTPQKQTAEAADEGPQKNEGNEENTEPAEPIFVNAQSPGAQFHASPAVRQFARELGVELESIAKPSGPKGRITFADVKTLVKSVMSRPNAASATNTLGRAIPEIELPDFRKFGEIEERALSKIKQLTGEHLHKGWLNIPLVTHFEEADISELEAFRSELNQRPAVAVAKGELPELPKLPKTTALSFIVKAVVRALQQYPQLNSSISSDGKSIILKKYYNIGIAVDTPRGLLVPVIPNADALSLDQISAQIKMLGTKGRAGKLGPQDMEGGTFTISSLGSLGGTNFTPLVNTPEAAILGVAKAQMKPVWNGSEFAPRLILPFSVSYDHRILDGGEVARFGAALAGYLGDLRYILV